MTHQTVLRCLGRAVRLGVMAALDDSPRPGKAAEITAEAKAWLVSLACRKAKDLGYPQKGAIIRFTRPVLHPRASNPTITC